MTSKETTKSTAADKYKELFDSCPYPISSDFEQENFNNGTGSAQARSVIDTVNRVRKIDSDLETETRTFEKKCLEEEKTNLLAVLYQQDSSSLAGIVANWQQDEQDYWVNFLGKQAAIELLTFGKPTVGTMTKMVRLPEELYVKATQICVRLANAIRQATTEAELAIGIANTIQDEGSDDQLSKPITPKKLLLKKIK